LSIFLCLNELSLGAQVDRSVVDSAMGELIDLLRAVRGLRSDMSVVSAVPLKDVELGAGYFVQQWIGADRRNHDRWLYIRDIQNRAPFSTVLASQDPYLVEYRFADQVAEGLGAAHQSSGLAISLGVDELWEGTSLKLDRLVIGETDDGFEEEQDEVVVHHASRKAHVDVQAEWIERLQADEVSSGSDIWDQRGDLFPDLTFLPRVEDQLRMLALPSVRVVWEKLIALERSVREWRRSGAPWPTWQMDVRPENEGRESYCMFEDIDGVTRLFELHVRFPPRPGRIHFRVVSEDRSARVAHVGRKLGI
jgi:hypothetical protein